jgi:poly-gamma-glutamate synthesis protein (capsule biosynthesis protein)
MNNGTTRLLLVGDVMLGRLVNDMLRCQPAEYPWGDTLPLFREADWRACNLECAISDQGSPWTKSPKVFHFRSEAKNVAVLKAAGIDTVSLANNHTLDFNYPAFFDTLEILDRSGIAHSGAGANFFEASRAAMAEVHGVNIGLLSFTDNQPDWEATINRAGIFYVPVDSPDARADALLELVHVTKDQVNFLIVSAHWGPNWGRLPPVEHIELAKKLIEAGADVVFGHSAHVFRGVEFHLGRPIIYSGGDFIDDYAVDCDERNDWSFIFILELEGERLHRLRLHPTVIRCFQAQIAEGEEARAIAAKMSELCAMLETITTWNSVERCAEVAVPHSLSASAAS